MDAVDEGKIVQQLENVQEILNQYHPLKFRDDDEDEDSGEEERISNQLERMQKKAMKKMENRLNAVNEDDDNYANNLDEETEFSDSGDEESMDCDSMEKPPQANNSKSNQISRKSIETKLNHMWTEYQNRLKDIESIDVKKVKFLVISLLMVVHYSSNISFVSNFHPLLFKFFSYFPEIFMISLKHLLEEFSILALSI